MQVWENEKCVNVNSNALAWDKQKMILYMWCCTASIYLHKRFRYQAENNKTAEIQVLKFKSWNFLAVPWLAVTKYFARNSKPSPLSAFRKKTRRNTWYLQAKCALGIRKTSRLYSDAVHERDLSMIFYLRCNEIESHNNELLLCKKNQSLFFVVPMVNPERMSRDYSGQFALRLEKN